MPTAEELIPFQIIKRDEFRDAKVSFDVRVDLVDGRLPTEGELAAVSRHLKRRETPHDRTFVCFYLPGMEVDAGCFATAHHTPDLDVRILSYNIPERLRRIDERARRKADREPVQSLPEDEAARKLDLAKRLKGINPDAYQDRLQGIVDEFPGTAAAEDAAALLKEL